MIFGISAYGKSYLMKHIPLRKQGPILIITKSLNQYPNLTAQISVGNQPLEFYENSTVVFDDVLLSKQASKIDLFFPRGRHRKLDIYYISQSCFHLPKNTIRNNSNKIIFFKRNLRDIILLFHDIAGLDKNLEEWKELCTKASENDHDCSQKDRFA